MENNKWKIKNRSLIQKSAITKPLFIFLLLFTVLGSAFAQSRSENDRIYSKNEIRAAMSRVFEWQVSHPVDINLRNNNLWARGAFYTGIMSAYRATKDKTYLDQALKWANERDWKLGERPRHADDQVPGQIYLELYLLEKDPARIANTKATLDAMIANPKTGREDWWWCDSLFMSPPVLARLYTATGDQNYLKFLHTMWWDSTDFLFDPAENLYYRDKNYIGKPNANGKKVFWGTRQWLGDGRHRSCAAAFTQERSDASKVCRSAEKDGVVG